MLGMMIYVFLGAIPTTTQGGMYVIHMLDTFGPTISILFVVFCETIAVCWFYGTKRLSADIKSMLGFEPGLYWRLCWVVISPVFVMVGD